MTLKLTRRRRARSSARRRDAWASAVSAHGRAVAFALLVSATTLSPLWAQGPGEPSPTRSTSDQAHHAPNQAPNQASALTARADVPGPMQRAHSPGQSSIIYAPSSSALRFAHGKHAQTPCVACHLEANTSAQAKDDLRPSMRECVSCHAAPGASLALHDCAGCHDGYASSPSDQLRAQLSRPAASAQALAQLEQRWREARPAPMIPSRTTPRLRFSHAAHLRLAGPQERLGAAPDARCASCHAPDAQGQPTLPDADVCASCHNDAIAPTTCETCHLREPSRGVAGADAADAWPGAAAARPRLATRFDQPGQRTPARLMPTDHTVDWVRRHGAVAMSHGDDCMSCHAQTSCSSCHQASGATPRAVHPPNFVVVHRVAAQSQENNCTSCHSQQTFCASCHLRTRHVPTEQRSPPPRQRFHPAGWLDRASANNHGVSAKRNINDCASCHQERDCLSCHRGISPHPPTYRLDCKRALRANAAPCAQCHQDLQALERRCL